MSSWIILFSAFFISLSAISDQLRNTSLTGNHDRYEDEDEGPLVDKDLTIAWIYKPPYTLAADNQSQEGHILIRGLRALSAHGVRMWSRNGHSLPGSNVSR